MRIRSIIKFIAIAIVVLIIIGYGLAKTQDLIFGTKLIIESPQDGETLDDEVVEIKGVARSATKLEINGKEVVADESGNFSKQYVLADGYNLITISATDRFGRITKEILRLNYEGSDIDTQVQNLQNQNATSTENTTLNATSSTPTEEATTSSDVE